MRSKQSLYNFNSSRGLSSLELLVTTSLGLIIGTLVLSLTQTSHYFLGRDIARTRLNQNLRGAVDIIGTNVRIGGESLPENFPAFLIENGASGSSDELVVRRSLLSEVLSVCVDIPSGAAVTDKIEFGNSSTTPGCSYSSNTFSYSQWKSYRSGEGGSVRGFLYDTATGTGEFFNYIGEQDTGSELRIQHDKSAWTSSYTAGLGALYLIEEWRYRLVDGSLQIIEDGDDSNPHNVSFNIADFQVSVTLNDDTVKTAFNASDTWTDIKYIQIQVDGNEGYAGDTLSRSLTGRFFPRNILSY